ncbi:TPA: hypothetical protein ACSCV5_002673 [Staphylococcus aureus]
MKPTKVILKDASYLHSKTSITFILKDVVIEEDNKIYYFDTSATFEDQEVKFEFALFDSDMDNLKHMDYDNPVTEIYFIEPDLHFTIIDFNQELLCIYIDFDSGLRHSSMAKESGISLRINVAKSDFTKFINELASLH